MWRLPRTLLWRLGLALIITQVLVGLVLGWYAYEQVREFHLNRTFESLERQTPLYVDRYAAWYDGDASKLDGFVKEDGRRSGARITVVRADGEVMADSRAEPEAMDNHRFRAEIAAALEHGQGSSLRFSNTVGETLLYFARRAESPSGATYVVRTALPLTKINADFARVARVIGLAGALSLLATAAAFYFISRRFSTQVRGLARGAARFASGDLDHRIAQPAAAELSVLARSLNRMAAELNDRIEQLEMQQGEQRAILQSMSNGVIALDRDHRILNANRAAREMLEIDEETARGRLLQEVVRQPEIHRFVQAALTGAAVDPREFKLVGPQPRRIQAACERLTAADGTPKGLLLILNDVTELRKLESIRSDFAANVSHELQTPITNLKGYIETLLDVGFDDREQAERFARVIKQNCDRLAAIVRDVMALTQFEQPRAAASLDREAVPVSSILRSVLSQFKAAAERKNAKLVIEVTPDDLEVRVHAQLIEQAIGNLVSNAISYGPPGGTVTMCARQVQEEIAIAVTDEGPGIAEQHLPRLFERFYRVDRGRSRELGGTGLGLAIVKHIALIHGGRVDVCSKVGSGSTFRVWLPVG